ncbi:MAG: UTP--glucose-1-phosphate uridylyltransferase [Verrucomicrobium sp.]|nr:UTP--glucose-1-phosphate uridylyltransferase [Verrucomicrobium sp.]
MADFSLFARLMEGSGASAAAISSFRRSYEALARGETGQIPEPSIEALASLPVHQPGKESSNRSLLSQACILKLNGGLGTGMGLERAKSLLPVKEGLTFLDLICRHVLRLRKGGDGPGFLLMDSFTTSADTRAFLAERYPSLGGPETWELLQNKAPKVDAATLAPAQAADPDMAWCPPGHGDLYAALAGSGRLASLLEQGFRYLFVSNADNLGATLDPLLLERFAASGAPFLMEVTERTEADRKGGHLCRDRATGRLRLREIAQCPPEDQAAFGDISRHRFFNTNNLWIDLRQLRAALEAGQGSIALPVIFNRKTVDPRDPASPAVIQLETAMGAAIEAFEGAEAVVVPRTRFLPVKTTNDLLALRSDAYALEEETLRLRAEALPLIDLDGAHYKRIDDFDAKFAAGIPSLRSCRRLTVRGPVLFSSGVRLQGAVTVTNPRREDAPLPPGAYADREVTL